MTEQLERTILDLIATDRLYRPSSSFDGKLERRRPKIAKQIVALESFEDEFFGDRAYARVSSEETQKARGIRAGIDEFSKKYPQYGTILNGLIEEKRVQSETHLYFGMQEGRRLTHEDYMGVLTDMGLSPERAEQYYQVAIEISRNLMKKDDTNERSVLIGND